MLTSEGWLLPLPNLLVPSPPRLIKAKEEDRVNGEVLEIVSEVICVSPRVEDIIENEESENEDKQLEQVVFTYSPAPRHAFSMIVSHLFFPSILIPALSAGVSPPNASCGRMKLW